MATSKGVAEIENKWRHYEIRLMSFVLAVNITMPVRTVFILVCETLNLQR